MERKSCVSSNGAETGQNEELQRFKTTWVYEYVSCDRALAHQTGMAVRVKLVWIIKGSDEVPEGTARGWAS